MSTSAIQRLNAARLRRYATEAAAAFHAYQPAQIVAEASWTDRYAAPRAWTCGLSGLGLAAEGDLTRRLAKG